MKKAGLKAAALVVCGALCLGLAACSGATTAAFITAIGQAVDSIIALEVPGWSGAPLLNGLFAQASSDAAQWQPGTSGAAFTAVLNDLAGALDEIPLNPKIDDLVGIALSAIDGITAIVQSESAAVTQPAQVAAFDAWLTAGPAAAPTARKHTWKGPQPKSLSDFQKAWNQNAPANAKVKTPGLFRRAWNKVK